MHGKMKLIATLFMNLCLIGLANSAASSCDTSSMEVVQTINSGPINIFYVGIVSPDWCTKATWEGWDPAASLPRFTWTLEPAPDGSNETTVKMSPPDLGTLLYDLGTDGVGSIDGIQINPDVNLTNGTDVGIAVQIPRDQLIIAVILGEAPFYVNIAPGFTNISGLESERSNHDYYCGDGEYETVIAGRGSAVVADLSSAPDFWALSIYDNGADWTVKLPEGKPNNVNLRVDALNAKVRLQGSINCTDQYACFLLGGSRAGCTEDCATQLVVDGSVLGNVTVNSVVPYYGNGNSFGEEYTGNATFVIATTEPDGCDHFNLDDGDYPFDCTYDASAVVQVEEFPCTVAAGEGGPMDVLQCQGDIYDGGHVCNCAVPGVCPAPSPAPSPSSSSSTHAITGMFATHAVIFAAGLALVL